MRLKKLLLYFKQSSLFFLYSIVPFSFFYLKYSNLTNSYYLYIKNSELLFFSIFLKKFQNTQISSLSDITVIDNYNFKKRFKLVYNFLSNIFGTRVFLTYFLTETKPVATSLISLFPGSNWIEREAWDMFGIFFLQHNDLRRILTDYGFKGFPFRKDFPLTGYIELRFDDFKQDIVYEPVELSQELRFFNFSSSWEKNF